MNLSCSIRQTKIRLLIVFLTIVAITSILSTAHAQLPNGFVIYTEGGNFHGTERWLRKATLEEGWSEGQVQASIVDIFPYEKDQATGWDVAHIEPEISLDGEMIAWQKCVGGGDWHGGAHWTIMIMNLQTAGARPIQITEKGGHWCSWSDNSDGYPKTLYYCWNPTGTASSIRSVRVNADGTTSNDRQVVDCPGVNIAQMAPNGQWYVSWSSNVGVTHIAGQHAGQTFGIAGGCMPQVCTDSRWVLHAKHVVGNYIGEHVNTHLGGVGEYHHNVSNDMKWIVSKCSGDYTNQNRGGNLKLMPISVTETSFDVTGGGITISNNGSSADIHVSTGSDPVQTGTPMDAGMLKSQHSANATIISLNGKRINNAQCDNAAVSRFCAHSHARGIYIARFSKNANTTAEKSLLEK